MKRDAEYKEAMYQVKINHFTEKGHDIEGVMHVGTNYGYEFQWYRKMGIEYFVGFEPLKLAIEAFRQGYPLLQTGREFFFPFALGARNCIRNLKIASGDGQGSTFLESLSGEQFMGEETVQIRRFDDLVIDTAPLLPLKHLDCLVLDVQGMELDALKGMGEYLRDFKYLNIECSMTPVYKGEASGEQVSAFLKGMGFRQDSPMEVHNDVFFLREDL